MKLCVGCGKRPPEWRGFCFDCAKWLGFIGRRLITQGGQSERRRAIERIRVHLGSIRAVGGGAQR